ncbi:MAG: hypothetical protein IJR01_03265 [Bacteroidales bacterium]|nr:hypothetical protein [Bacteroidales bacterium]
MDIDLLSKMVKELIMEADEVALPGVGSFIAETEPASFSDKGYTINPPYRKLSFRQRLAGNDNALIDFYATTNGIPVEQAAPIITAFLIELKEVLKEKKVVVFPGLGRLRATKENNFFFVADEDLDIYPQGFGLEPISLKTHQETPEEVSDAIQRLGAIISPDVSEQEEITDAEPVEEPVLMEDEPIIDIEPAEEVYGDDTIEVGPADDIETVEEEETPVDSEVVESDEKHKSVNWWKVVLILLAVFVGLILLFAILARIFPDFFDTILYTREELQIIYYR